MERGLLLGLLLSSGGFAGDLADARTLSVNRAYADGGNSEFTPAKHIRRPITADHELQVTGTTEFDIQQKLDEARILGLDNPGTTIVVTLEPGRNYDIRSPLVIHSHTVLEGNGAVLEVAPALVTALSRVVTLTGDSSGIHSCNIRANSLVTRATVVVAAGATNAAIFDNRISGDVETSGPPLIDVEGNVANLEVDGNELVNMTKGILLGRENIVNTSIRHNRFANWHDWAILVKNRSFQTPLSTIDIYGNHIEPPHPSGVVRQPIAFQSNTVGASQIRDVRIRHNKITGNDQPYIVGQLDDFSEEDGEIVPIGNTGRYRLLNGATADMISLHDVSNFDIFANDLAAGGEVGISISRGAGDGMVRWNSVTNQDTSGINIASNLGANSPGDDPLRVFDVDVFRNSIINPGRNRADPNSNCHGPANGNDEASVQRWARSGITVQFADDVILHHNHIEETEAAFNTVCFGIYSRGNTTNLIINAPTFDFVAEGVIWSPKNSSVDIFPLDFAVDPTVTFEPIDFNRDRNFDCADVDPLVREITAATNDPIFDLDLDGLVQISDLEIWLEEAALQNGWRSTYRPGDTNLDGVVDARDLSQLGLNWRQDPGGWCGADFNADGIVNSADLNAVGVDWNQAMPRATEAIPEPSIGAQLVILLACLAASKPR